MVRKLSKPTIPTATAPSSTPSGPSPSTFSDGLPLPKLFVFDLDYTLWPFWVDTHVSPPLKPSSTHTHITDRSGEQFAFYRDVPSILTALHAHKDVLTGAASRTSAPDLAREMLKGLHIDFIKEDSGKNKDKDQGEEKSQIVERKRALGAFDQMEIYPGDKKRHMRRLKDGLGVEFEDMLFFDDESRNRNVEELGVTMWLVRDGVSRVEIDKGVREWRTRRGFGAGVGSVGKGDGMEAAARLKEEL